MKTRIKSFASLFTSLVLVLAAAIAVGYFAFADSVTDEDECRDVIIQTVSDDAERIVIASPDGTEYEMYFSSDAMQMGPIVRMGMVRPSSAAMDARIKIF